jgi:hypothetical protein
MASSAPATATSVSSPSEAQVLMQITESTARRLAGTWRMRAADCGLVMSQIMRMKQALRLGIPTALAER